MSVWPSLICPEHPIAPSSGTASFPTLTGSAPNRIVCNRDKSGSVGILSTICAHALFSSIQPGVFPSLQHLSRKGTLVKGSKESLVVCWGPLSPGDHSKSTIIHARSEFISALDRKSTRLNSSHLGISY